MNKLSEAGVSLIKRFEGLKLKAYKDSAGVWTIGYGHTSAAGKPKVTSGLVITAEEAEDILKRDLLLYEKAVNDTIKRPMNPNQYAAMVSLCYNIGPGAFAKSTVARKFNEGAIFDAADGFMLWIKAGGKILKGLVNRREAERKMFLNPFVKSIESAETPTESVPVVKKKKTIYDLIIDIFFAIFGGK